MSTVKVVYFSEKTHVNFTCRTYVVDGKELRHKKGQVMIVFEHMTKPGYTKVSYQDLNDLLGARTKGWGMYSAERLKNVVSRLRVFLKELGIEHSIPCSDDGANYEFDGPRHMEIPEEEYPEHGYEAYLAALDEYEKKKRKQKQQQEEAKVPVTLSKVYKLFCDGANLDTFMVSGADDLMTTYMVNTASHAAKVLLLFPTDFFGLGLIADKDRFEDYARRLMSNDRDIVMQQIIVYLKSDKDKTWTACEKELKMHIEHRVMEFRGKTREEWEHPDELRESKRKEIYHEIMQGVREIMINPDVRADFELNSEIPVNSDKAVQGVAILALMSLYYGARNAEDLSPDQKEKLREYRQYLEKRIKTIWPMTAGAPRMETEMISIKEHNEEMKKAILIILRALAAGFSLEEMSELIDKNGYNPEILEKMESSNEIRSKSDKPPIKGINPIDKRY